MINQETKIRNSSKNQIVEWAPFTIKESVTEQALLDASQALQDEFLSTQPGYIRRDLLKGEGGQWLDIVYWESNEQAQNAMKVAMSSEAALQYFSLMQSVGNDAEEGVSHFVVKESY